MSEQRWRSGVAQQEEPDWIRHLRAALDDTLVDIRVAEDEDGYDFLPVH